MDNVEWLFSGIGVTIVIGIVGLFINKKLDAKNTQNITSGENCNNIQGDNVTVTIGGKKDV